MSDFKLLNAQLNPICQLLALLGAHPILHVSRIRVKHIWSFSTDFRKGLTKILSLGAALIHEGKRTYGDS
jgi:hypothetical protein